MEKPVIHFNEKRHLYIVDGKVVPSVSEIMRPLTEDFYKRVPERIMEKKRKIGTEVHKAIEIYIMFGIVSPAYKGYVEQFAKFMSDKKLKVYLTEVKLSDRTYAGTIDLVMIDEDQNIYLYDLKTTTKIHDDLLEVQLTGYRKLLEFYGLNVKACFVLQLTDKEYITKEIETNSERWNQLINEYKNKVHKHKTSH